MNEFNLNCFRATCLIVCCVLASQVTADEKTKVNRVRFYVATPEGENAKLYLVPGEYHTAGSPTFSAEGQKLAFDGRKSQNGERFSQGMILVANADGNDLKTVGSGVMPSWSPGGNRIAISNIAPRGVAIMHANGSNHQMIDDRGWGAQWSPDGKNIAYTIYGPGGPNICIYDLIEETKTNLFPEGECPYSQLYWNMTWSPDSNWLCFKGRKKSDRSYDIATVNTAGQKEGFKIHYNNKQAPYADFAWHPQGDTIVFGDGSKPQNLLKFNPAEDKAPEPLNIKVKGTILGDVCFTPDGRYLLFNVSGVE